MHSPIRVTREANDSPLFPAVSPLFSGFRIFLVFGRAIAPNVPGTCASTHRGHRRANVFVSSTIGRCLMFVLVHGENNFDVPCLSTLPPPHGVLMFCLGSTVTVNAGDRCGGPLPARQPGRAAGGLASGAQPPSGP